MMLKYHLLSSPPFPANRKMNVAPTETFNLLINPFYSFLKIKKADILKNDLDLNSKFNLTLILWL